MYSLMNTDDLTTQLADTFRLLGDASRLRIVMGCLDGPLAVGDIAARLDLSQSLVSHHLRLLRAARLVRSERRGKQVFYSVADDHIRTVLTDMADHLAEPQGSEPHGSEPHGPELHAQAHDR